MDAQITAFLNDAIKLIGGILMTFIAAYVKQHYTAKQVETSKSLAKLGVKFADELQHTLGIKGEEKLNAAIEQAKLQVGSFGIKLSDEQWSGLIKSVLNESRSIYNATQGGSQTIKSSTGSLQQSITQAIESQIQSTAQDAASKAIQGVIDKTIQDAVNQVTETT